MKRSKYSILTMFAHLCTDINQGALPAILPFLVLYKDISLAQAAGLIFAANSMSSFIQPLFGYLGDKVSWPWIMAVGVFLAGAGISTIGFLDNYWAIFVAVMVSGIGIALFHPEGGKIANLSAGEKKGAGLGVFAVGGNLGLAIGPVIASVAILTLGLKGTVVLIIPVAIMASIILINLKDLGDISSEAHKPKMKANGAKQENNWPAFTKVSACITCRSVINYGLTTFIPLYFVIVLLQTEIAANLRLTIFSISAAAATLMGGYMADKIGFLRIIRGCNAALVPLLIIFPLVGNVFIATLFVIPMAFALSGSHSTLIATGQAFMPNRIGTSSGIMLGLTVSVGGMIAPAIGWIGDHFGLQTAMFAVAGFSVLALTFAYMIPDPAKQKDNTADAPVITR